MPRIAATTRDYVVLPVQFFPGGRLGAAVHPEQRLMLAVLEAAVHTFVRHAGAGTHRGRRLRLEVEEWFASDDTSWPFSFVRICQGLRLDPSYLRRGLRNLDTAPASPSRDDLARAQALLCRVTGPRTRTAITPARRQVRRREAPSAAR
jgi:hypothetical protein